MKKTTMLKENLNPRTITIEHKLTNDYLIDGVTLDTELIMEFRFIFSKYKVDIQARNLTLRENSYKSTNVYMGIDETPNMVDKIDSYADSVMNVIKSSLGFFIRKEKLEPFAMIIIEKAQMKALAMEND